MNWIFFLARKFLKVTRGRGLRAVFLLSLIGMMLGVGFLLVTQSISQGLRAFFEKTVLDFNAHIIVRANEESDLSAELQRLQNQPNLDIAGITPFMYREALIVFQSKVKGVSIKGIDPKLFSQVYGMQFSSYPQNPELNSSPNNLELPEMWLGQDLARELGIDHEVKIRVFLPQEQEREEKKLNNQFRNFKVTGTFSSGFYNFDNTFALMDIKFLQELYQKPDAASGFEIRLKSSKEVPRKAEEIQNLLGPDFEVIDWQTFNSTLFEGLNYEKTFFFLVLCLVVFVAAFNVAGFLILMIFERSRELSILRALGARSKQLKTLMTFLGLWLGGLGSIGGILLGLGLIFYVKNSRYFELDPEIYWVREVPFQISWVLMVSIFLASMMIVYIVVRWALRRLEKMPLDL